MKSATALKALSALLMLGLGDHRVIGASATCR